MSIQPVINLDDLTPFEAHTVAELAAIRANVEDLAGPAGRVTKLENKVLRIIVVGAVLGVLTAGPAALAWFIGG